MSANNDLKSVLVEELNTPDSGWSIGSMGAIAEFHQSQGEELLIDDTLNLTRATSRGAIRLHVPDNASPIAYEAVSPKAHRWMQGVAICLPASDIKIERRSVLTELGADQNAIRSQDRHARLFDMGLDQPQIQFCVRTSDPDLTALLLEHCGKSLFAEGNPAMGAILKLHPHRVALSNLGRVEVFQLIGGPDTGGVSPEGPHTHVLPKLLRTGRTHSANTPIPKGLLPCASLHPANPVIDPLGKDREFNPHFFERFQQFLDAWGPREYVDVKHTVWTAVEAGRDPTGFSPPSTRLGRTAVRNALRQSARIASHQNDQTKLARLSKWRERFDQHRSDEQIDPDSPGH